jgi:hypothetical protein
MSSLGNDERNSPSVPAVWLACDAQAGAKVCAPKPESGSSCTEFIWNGNCRELLSFPTFVTAAVNDDLIFLRQEKEDGVGTFRPRSFNMTRMVHDGLRAFPNRDTTGVIK